MINRLYTAAAVAAAIALSTSFALSRTDAQHGAPVPGHSASGSSHVAAASAPGAGSRLNGSMATAAGLATAGAHQVAPAASAAAAGPTSSTPTLVSVQGGAHVLARGAQQATPVAVSEDQAMKAIFKGGMWLPNATGGREYAKYDHHLIHDNGDWTWVGKVQTDHGLQSAVITFGKDAVFGLIPQAGGHPLRLVTAGGQKMLVQTDGRKMAASSENLQLHAHQDFMVPQHRAEGSRSRTTSASAQVAKAAQTVASASTTSGGPVIDVMVAYTPGLVSAYGSASAALTRINNLVDTTNQAYADSGVNQRVRLVHTMQVNYTDTNKNDIALDDLTGNDGAGNSVPVPSSLQGVASARTQYGADLVVLLRHFNEAGNNGCGLAWLIGGGEQQIIPSEDNAFGYSVVQDGSDNGYYCLDTTFAHELGHDMGSAHDRANASKDSNGNPIPGAYSYSYGYLGGGTTGFSTIMAYGNDTQTPLPVFSNPDMSTCENSPCGVADSSTSSADNVHSLNNTASLIAQFEGTKVRFTFTDNDVDGDSKSDLFWYSSNLHEMTYWLMDGAKQISWKGFPVPADYQPAGVGDFNGDKQADILWTDNNHDLYMWVSDGTGGFTSHLVVTYKSYSVAGVADMDGDGKSDIIWFNKNSGGATYWLMDGWSQKSWRGFNMPPIYHLAGVGDFNGNGRADLVWASDSNHQVYVWVDDGNGGVVSHLVNVSPSGWSVAGVGDANGDGNSDIYWYNQGTGQFTYWLMNGVQKTSWRSFTVVNSYRPIEIADYDGNGRADVLWTSDARHLWMWTDDGTGDYRKQLVVEYSSSFEPFGN